jgi:hypothetical protein
MPNRPTKGKDQQGPGIETTPRYPETTPPLSPSPDFTWVLETVMSMHGSMGKLTEAVESLKTTQTEQGRKIDGISHRVYAAMVLLILIGGVVTFFAKSINDLITSKLLAPSAVQQQAAPTPIPQPTVTPRSR